MSDNPHVYTTSCTQTCFGHPHTLNQTSLLAAQCRHIILVGQDKRELGALVFPDEEYLAAAAAPAEDAAGSSAAPSSGAAPGGGALAGAALEEVLFKEVARLNSGRPDYHPEDHIAHIKVGAARRACARCLDAVSSTLRLTHNGKPVHSTVMS